MTKAIKEHTCRACGGVIAKGEDYTNKERAGQYRGYDSLHNGCVLLFQQQQDKKDIEYQARLINRALCSHRYENTPNGRVCRLCGWVDYRNASRSRYNPLPKRSMRGLH